MKKRSLLSRITFILFAIVGAVFAAYLTYVFAANNVSIFDGRPHSDYYTVTDYTCTDIRDESAPVGIVIEYSFTVPQISESDTHLAFYTTHQYSETYVGGELVYSVVQDGDNNIATVGSNWIIIPLSAQDAGKEITVRITPVYEPFVNRGIEFILGSDLAIYRSYLEKNLPQLILCAINILAGIIFIGTGIFFAFRKKQCEEVIMLGLFSAMVGFWRLFDNRFTPFMFDRDPTFIFYLSIVMLMFACVPFAKMLSSKYNRVTGMIIDFYCIAVLLIGIIQLALQVFGILDIRQTLIATHIMLIIGVLIILSGYINLFFKRKKKSEDSVMLSPIICIVGAIIDEVEFFLHGTSAYLAYTMLAFVIFTVIEGIRIIYDYTKRGKILADQEKELLKSRVLIMLSQIKPHFLYNSLGSISELCVTDPERAREALVDFSDYLRSNMDSIGNDEIIPFSKELKHIECYLNLEKIRFGSRLKVVYDIKVSDFSIPTLTIQPLVENAVKHGVCAKKEGGTVTLATRREENRIIVSVIDDGVGFDGNAAGNTDEKDTRSHVGLENVQKRLEQLAGASVEIKSRKGKGTAVEIIMESNPGKKV